MDTTNSKLNVHFSGQTIETTVTNKASMVDEWVTEIRSLHNGNRIILGLDCEWRNSDRWGMFTKIATLQLSVGNKCLIVQMAYLDYCPQSLSNFLSDPNVTCVGVEVYEDVERLKNEYGIVCGATADLRQLSMSRQEYRHVLYRRPGLKDIARYVVNLIMEKPRHICMGDWQVRVLNEQQIRYACLDAYVSHRIGRKLLLGNRSFISRV